MAEKGRTDTSKYLNLLKSTRIQIDEKYEKVIQMTSDKKFSMQTLIDDLEAEYLELETVRENELAKLQSVLLIYQDTPGDNRANEVQERVRKGIQDEIDNLEANTFDKEIKFIWDSELEKKIEELGSIKFEEPFPNQNELKPPPEAPTSLTKKKFDPNHSGYKSIECPKVENYSPGSESDQLSNPGGLSVCQDDTFYVADYNNNRVTAYTKWGKLKFSFQHLVFMGMVNKMQGPWGLCCHGDHIYLTESKGGVQHAALKMFTLNGTWTAEITKFGRKNGELNDPTGLDFDEEKNELYVCDRGNNRVQIFTPNLEFLRIFVAKGLDQPRDVKVGNRLVFILDGSDSCMQLFHKDTGKVSEQFRLQEIVKPVNNPWFFALDRDGNIIISDMDNNLIQIFSQDGKLLSALGDSEGVNFVRPTGVAINASGNIISVCMKETGCLQIF